MYAIKHFTHACAGTLLFAVFAIGTPQASAADTLNGVSVEKPWARASAGKARNGGAFIKLINHGKADDRLIEARGDIAKRIELHTHIMDNGIMRMRQVKDIPVPAGKTVSLQPGGLHIMMIGLHAPLTEGTSFPLHLIFESGAQKTIHVSVLKAGARTMGHKMDHNMSKDMKHGNMDTQMHNKGMNK